MPDEPTASAAEQLAQVLAGPAEAQEEPASEVPEPAAEEDQHEAEQFNLQPEVPEDVRELLDEPDFEAEAEAEIEQEEPQEEYVEEDYVDPNLAAERKKRLAAEKKLQWMEQQRVKENRSKWEAEAVKYFPLSKINLDNINATSRRAFLREAERVHQNALPVFQEVTKMFEAQIKEAQTETTEAQRTAEKQQWGPAVVGGQGVPPEAAALQARRAKYDYGKASGDLVAMIKNSDYFDVPGGS